MRFVPPRLARALSGHRRAAPTVRVRRGGPRFLRSELGASMAEYALLVAVIAVVAAAGGKRLGTTMRDGANYVATFFR